MKKGFLSHQEGVDTGEKMGLVAGDRGVKLFKLGSKELGNEFVLMQDSVNEVDGLEVTVGARAGLAAGGEELRGIFKVRLLGGRPRLRQD